MVNSRTVLPNSLSNPVQAMLFELAQSNITHVAVGLSGGADSVALTVALSQYCHKFGITLHAVHVHHGIYESASQWLDFAHTLSDSLQIRFHASYVSLAQVSQLGIEASARQARYQAFADYAQAHQIQHIFLAHHLNDQAETVLLRLLRGAGTTGLGAMQSRRLVNGITYLRPWLNSSRQTILDWILPWAKDRNYQIVDDPSNLDPSYARGFLRTEILPRLEHHWPSYQETLARHARLAQEAHELITLTLLPRLRTMSLRHNDGRECLDIQSWAATSDVEQRWLLRYWLDQQSIQAPSEALLYEAQRQLLSASQQIKLALGDYVLRKYRGLAWLEQTSDAVDYELVHEFRWQGEGEVILAKFNGRLRFYEATTGICPRFLAQTPLILHYRRGGERMQIHPNRPNRELKKIFQELAIPKSERDQLLMLSTADTLIYIQSVGVNVAVPHASPGICIEWLA